MKTKRSAAAALGALLAMASAAFAQDHSAEGHAMAEAMDVPQACRTAEAPTMPSMESMRSDMENAKEHQKAMMQGMMETEGAMMRGMMADDPDVAFACAMIPHHQGAINMAEVELEHGDSEEMKELAQKIINDQKKEIEQLTTWIEQNAR